MERQDNTLPFLSRSDSDRNEQVDEALERKARELELLASIYHRHGHIEKALDIYNTLEVIRKNLKQTKYSTIHGESQEKGSGQTSPG